ncbi:MAG TPA: M48 family metallopeptidase, partial [Kiloniellales bacterium]|nr:M48 family metallopeptidase [Kiloniellales bacterium]
VLATAAVLLLLAVLWQLLPAAARWTAAAVPPAWEERIGERAYGQILGILARFSEAPPRICDDPEGLAALETLTRRLAGAAGPSAYDFRPVVLDLEMVNALALPGGRILLFGGLIEKAESGAEVAGVLAHEMGHVIRRHGTESIVRSVGVSVVFDLLLGGSGSLPSALGETLVRASYSREAETEADRTALALLEDAGIRAEGLVRFFERLHETDGELPPGFDLLSSHPRSDARAELFARADSGGPALTEAQWRALEGICGEPDPE